MLPLLAHAQQQISVVTLKSGTVLKGHVKQIDPKGELVMEISGVETNIDMNDVAEVKSLDPVTISQQEEVPQPPVQKTISVVKDNLKDYKGFLLAKGNNVYVYSSNSDKEFVKSSNYDRAAGNVLRDSLKSDGFWNVVDNMSDAHFTINYLVDTRRSDRTMLSVSSFRTGASEALIITGGNEDLRENITLARKFYKKVIKPLQKKIAQGKCSKRFVKAFTKSE